MSCYAAAHADPQGPGDARPTALQIIKDEGLEGKLTDKVMVITGGSSGLGVETARALAATGAKLFLTLRSPDKAKQALGDIYDPSTMELVQMDHTSFDTVRGTAQTILSKTDKINVLVCNAGIMRVPTRQLTPAGHELQFATNHLAHFLLFHLLKPALLAAATPTSHSRVVMVSSAAHRLRGINPSDNYDFSQGEYDARGLNAYAQSKTANIYMANEIERRYGVRGLHATSLHPGGVWTGLTRYMSEEELAAEQEFVSGAGMNNMKSPAQGAATTVWAAAGAEWAAHGGRYLNECEEAGPQMKFGSPFARGYAPHAFDEEAEGRLWRDSLRLVGLED